MSKDDKPLEYERRIRDTKGVAQRLDLDYHKRTGWLAELRHELTGYFVVIALGVSIPLLIGIGSSRKTLANGPVSEAHAFYENRCESCHTKALSGRSIPMVWTVCITGVPPFGLPKIKRSVGRSFISTSIAAAA